MSKRGVGASGGCRGVLRASTSAPVTHIFIKSINHLGTKAAAHDKSPWAAPAELEARAAGNEGCRRNDGRPHIKLTSESRAPSQMALRSLVYHFYYTHLHFHISYLHFLCRYKSESLWLIRPLCAGPGDGVTAYRTLRFSSPRPHLYSTVLSSFLLLFLRRLLYRRLLFSHRRRHNHRPGGVAGMHT